MKRNDIEMFLDNDEGVMLLDGFDDAFIGVVERFNFGRVACYDYNKCISILERDMTQDDAVEYFEFNVIGAWVGDKTPFFLHKPTKK